MGDGEPRVPTAIAVTSADLALPPQDERTLPAAVLQDIDRRPLDQVLAELQTLVDQCGHVIVVCSQAAPAGVERRLHTVRGLLETDRIALFRPPLPPLGIAVLARQLRQLASCDLGAGVLASAGRLLTHYIHAGALLGSVARLDRVPVDLKAHARSWMPGSQFGVVAHPEPQLVRIGPEAALSGPEFGTSLLVAKGQLPSDWVTGTLAPSWRVQGLRETALPAESADWWGTGRLTEFCAYLPDLSVLYQLVTSVRQSACHWCGIDVIGDRCVFCSATPPVYDDGGGGASGRDRALGHRRDPALGRGRERRALTG
ncbi:hypothetical protein RVN83_23110 [Streptomyces sp. PU10]|uniref:hypothetical protein n=1 Tax=unclassified Streptomyces TaxID=2593676 RepID=UPI00106DD54B|nr:MULTISPECIES: hypothetical protein [unclassified Streptomyces]MBH5134304.1 hypothetical protein [Streptomyces sp. HB-N217]MDU0255953.1 hypothetical protein [Streptomyces sp. PU10]WSU01596.1 hypothetical protein OG368_13715 [Streptomyces sp. NBC_01124]